MPSKIRLQRISDRIRNEMSSMLLMEVQDPRLSGVSITDVRVDRELAYADIYVSAVEGHERSKEILDGLHSAAGFLRKELASRVELRVFPRLRFHWDPTPERADHIEKILAELREDDPSLREDDPSLREDDPSLATLSHPENTESTGKSTEDEANGDDE